MAILVAGGRRDRRPPSLGHSHEMMRRLCRTDRIDCDADISVGAVFETNRAGQSGSELAMHLAFGGACTDGTPGDEIVNVLWRDHVEELAPSRHSHLIQIEQQPACD